ncbi:MAG: hypothetical protein JRH16_22085 [Deltaproteobacteria bacterium]|nr:hypothetical protein [Deltaproteobacteria bacterium]MBW2362496.1 hypothetical protein [Deltaproteobacteria bacterium]
MSDVAEQLRRSLETLTRDEPKLIGRVYEDLFEHHPSVAEIFADHAHAVRSKMLRQVLEFAVDQADGATWLEENLTALGDTHEVNGVTAEMYGWFVDSLLRVFAEIAGPEWCAELEASWRTVLEQMSDRMLSAEQRAAS